MSSIIDNTYKDTNADEHYYIRREPVYRGEQRKMARLVSTHRHSPPADDIPNSQQAGGFTEENEAKRHLDMFFDSEELDILLEPVTVSEYVNEKYMGDPPSQRDPQETNEQQHYQQNHYQQQQQQLQDPVTGYGMIMGDNEGFTIDIPSTSLEPIVPLGITRGGRGMRRRSNTVELLQRPQAEYPHPDTSARQEEDGRGRGAAGNASGSNQSVVDELDRKLIDAAAQNDKIRKDLFVLQQKIISLSKLVYNDQYSIME